MQKLPALRKGHSGNASPFLCVACATEVGEGPERPSPLADYEQVKCCQPGDIRFYSPRSPEEERKQDAYQERLFLFFVTDPHLGLGRAICRAGLAAAAFSPRPWSRRGAQPLFCSFLGLHCGTAEAVAAKWGKTSLLPGQEAAVFLCGSAAAIPRSLRRAQSVSPVPLLGCTGQGRAHRGRAPRQELFGTCRSTSRSDPRIGSRIAGMCGRVPLERKTWD